MQKLQQQQKEGCGTVMQLSFVRNVTNSCEIDMQHLHEELSQQQEHQHQQEYCYQSSKEVDSRNTKGITNKPPSGIPSQYEEIIEIKEDGEGSKDATDREQDKTDKQSGDANMQDKCTQGPCKIPKVKVTMEEAASDIHDIKQSDRIGRESKDCENWITKLKIRNEDNSGEQIYDQPRNKTRDPKIKKIKDQPQKEVSGNIDKKNIRKERRRSPVWGTYQKPIF